MIDAPRLLADLSRLLGRLEDDLRQRIAEVTELKSGLQTEWQVARDAARTAETFESWTDQVITQAGVHWLLSCVFLRFIEDNELVERPWLGGTPQSGRLGLARDRHEAYFRERPLESDRDYLQASFREAGALPGLHTFFDEAHNPVFRLGISGDAAMALRQFWQQVDPNTGTLTHDFTDADWNTRFLGDLYQDLSEATRKRYALLQTPEFVEEFILDRTLTPAIREFGFREVRMIDPTCGSGHFLLGGFERLVDEWIRHEPARNPRDIAQRALDAVAGVDLNPFAVAISRFRLLVAALEVSGVQRLSEAPDFRLNVAIGDSLLHGRRYGMTATEGMFEGAEHYAGTGLAHAYASEDQAEVNRILGRQYHAVVGNPPYIVVKDAALNAAYRQRYASCHMKYSLGAPFTERFFELARSPLTPAPSPHSAERGEDVVPPLPASGESAGVRAEVRGQPPLPASGERAGVRGTRTRAEWQPILQEFARDMRHAPTDAEARLWYFLRNRRLDGVKFRRQHPIGPYIVDFISVEAGLVIELDGGQHALARDREKDAVRDAFLSERGLKVLRFWNNAVLADTMVVLERIWQEVTAPLTPSPPDPSPRSAGRGEHVVLPLKGEHVAPPLRGVDAFLPLPASGERAGVRGAGFVGLITANSFMKREFGARLIEQVLPRLDLTHVIDTSGAYIPGHGTPTVILFGRHRAPVGEAVRTVMGIKGEPNTPADPAQGLVWSAILGQIDRAGSESEFVTVGDTPRATFAKHPWSIGGGGAADLKEDIEGDRVTLNSVTDSIGITSFTLEDDVFLMPPTAFARIGVADDNLRGMVSGDELRDWTHVAGDSALFPYDGDFEPIDLPALPAEHRYMWAYRTSLSNNKMFGKQTKVDAGLKWWEYGRLTAHKLKTPLTITFAEVATHNHFVLDRGGKVFKQTAPVIKLPAGASEDEHLGLLGLLNSSVACFWLKQVCFPKGGDSVGGEGARVRKTLWDERYAFNASNIAEFPLSATRPLALARQLDTLARDLAACLPAARLRPATGAAQPLPTRQTLDQMRDRAAALRRQAVAWQEELDWECYRLYGLLPAGADALRHAGEPPEVQLGERAFEIVLARRIAAGRETTTWFERHGSTPVTEIPAHWPEDYRQLVQRRIDLIDPEPGQGRVQANRNIGLIERPEYKRRWNTPAWAELERAALREWLLDRLEAPHLWPASADHPPQLSTVNRLADKVRSDAAFMQIAALYAGHSGFDLTQIVAELVAGESVPFLPVLRYTDTGLRKRAQWQDTWALQRREDAGEQVGKIPVPPKYQSKDFLKADCWRLRGGLDVPKERWVSYPGCERGADGSLPIAWAGWNHLQQATALAAYFLEMKDNEGWAPARLQPLLAGLLELLPWLEQWHNDIDPAYGQRIGTYYRGFVAEEARALGFTLDDLRGWKPAAGAIKRGRKPRS